MRANPVAGFGRPDFEAAFRASISMLAPLLVLYLTGDLQLTAYATFGAFTSLYGRYEAYRQRMTTVSVAGAALLTVIATATCAAAFDWPGAVRLVALLIITAGGVVLSSVMRWIPFGPIFYVFGFSVCAIVPTTPSQVLPRIGVAAAAAAFSWLVCMSGYAVRRRAPGAVRGRLRELSPQSPRVGSAAADPVVYRVAMETVVALAVALWIASLTGLGHGYWAAVTVAATLPRPYAPHAFTRIFHRVLGTAAGVVIAGAFLYLQPSTLTLIIVIAVCQFGAEIFVAKIYGVALLFITPLALSVGRLSMTTSTESLLTDRLFETLIGGAVAAVVVGVVKLAEHRRSADSAAG